MDPNVSLQLSKRTDDSLWGRAISSIGRAVYSSSFNFYILLIASKRNRVVRDFNHYINLNDYKDENKREQISEKYKKSYTNYINSIEKYITDNLYTKVQKNAATIDEQNIISKYYNICKYKNEDQVLFRTKMEKLVLNTDWNTVQAAKSEGFISRFKEFYLYNIEELYKAEMRHDAILLANAKEGDRDQYEAIYSLIETYIKEVLPILPESDENNAIIKDYRKYVAALDTYEKKDFLELRKRLTLLGFSKQLFEYAFPMLAKEQCYKEIIEIARIITTNYYTDAEQFASYEVILDAIEEYVDNIQDYKTTWENEDDKKEYEKFKNKFVDLKKLARIDYEGYKRLREVLFIKYDLYYMNKYKVKLPEIRTYYRERLIIRNALRRLKRKATLISGSWRSKRKLLADNVETTPTEITATSIVEASPIDRLIENISSMVHEQVSAYTNIENVENTTEVPQICEQITAGTKTIINFANYIMNGGKKYKRRREL